MWSRAVWRENKREVEDVIPSSWIANDQVLWPNAVNAAPYVAECRAPGKRWRKFQLVKVKFSSGKLVLTFQHYVRGTQDVINTLLGTLHASSIDIHSYEVTSSS